MTTVSVAQFLQMASVLNPDQLATLVIDPDDLIKGSHAAFNAEDIDALTPAEQLLRERYVSALQTRFERLSQKFKSPSSAPVATPSAASSRSLQTSPAFSTSSLPVPIQDFATSAIPPPDAAMDVDHPPSLTLKIPAPRPKPQPVGVAASQRPSKCHFFSLCLFLTRSSSLYS
jgi:hypothetical protein